MRILDSKRSRSSKSQLMTAASKIIPASAPNVWPAFAIRSPNDSAAFADSQRQRRRPRRRSLRYPNSSMWIENIVTKPPPAHLRKLPRTGSILKANRGFLLCILRARGAITRRCFRTLRAHEQGKTHDWVVLFCDNGDIEHRFTVITSEFGRLEGQRIVAGREAECEKYYQRASTPLPD